MGDPLCDAIWITKSARLVKRIVAKMERVHSKYLFEALHADSEDVIRVLLEHGLDPNGPCELPALLEVFYLEKHRERNAKLLLEYGARVPTLVLATKAPIRPFVEAYIYRIWSHDNACDWPILLRKQIRAILCSVAFQRKRGIATPSSFLLLYLFRAVAAAHFVYDT